MYKKVFFVFLLLFALATFTFGEDIYFYVAAAMTKPAKEIADIYNKKSENKVIVITGGSGQILNKIIFSEKGDLYLPASSYFHKKAMDKGIVKKYWPLLYQIPVFGLSKSGEKKIKNFEDLYRKNVKIALGNKNTMALGKIYENIEKKMTPEIIKGIRKNQVVEAVNISQIVSYLHANTVDAGIIFDSVARVNNFKFINLPADASIKEEAIISLLKYSKNPSLAEEFAKYVLNHKEVFKKYGFSVIE